MKLKTAVAGQFYPREKIQLEKVLETFRTQSQPAPLPGEPVGMLLPHAGYPYSGAVASLGYLSLLSRGIETVVVAGPSHYVSFGGISIFAGEAVQTPLGDLPVDQEACRILMDEDEHFAEFPQAFTREHSVEVHFPLIRHFLPGAKVVPLVLGQGSEETAVPLVKGLKALRKVKPFLFVASSDLSHFPDYDTANKADRQFLEALLSGDEKKVRQADEKIMSSGLRDYHCTHCGREPVSALLKWARQENAEKIQTLAYRNSGDVTGDLSRVVGYSCVAFCK